MNANFPCAVVMNPSTTPTTLLRWHLAILLLKTLLWSPPGGGVGPGARRLVGEGHPKTPPKNAPLQNAATLWMGSCLETSRVLLVVSTLETAHWYIIQSDFFLDSWNQTWSHHHGSFRVIQANHYVSFHLLHKNAAGGHKKRDSLTFAKLCPQCRGTPTNELKWRTWHYQNLNHILFWKKLLNTGMKQTFYLTNVSKKRFIVHRHSFPRFGQVSIHINSHHVFPDVLKYAHHQTPFSFSWSVITFTKSHVFFCTLSQWINKRFYKI